jgi:hypothetical protein
MILAKNVVTDSLTSQVIQLSRALRRNFLGISDFLCLCNISDTSHPPWFDNRNIVKDKGLGSSSLWSIIYDRLLLVVWLRTNRHVIGVNTDNVSCRLLEIAFSSLITGVWRLHCQLLLSLAQSLRYNVQSKCQDKKIMSKSYQYLL